MSRIIIDVENLSKSYRLGAINHGMLYKDLQSWWAKTRGKEDPNSKISRCGSEREIDAAGHFWALKDISFSVNEGDVLGIIGKNGAGKSTILKILSKVTAPTKGNVKIKGRIASLLEVGTGFHPELTGRENILLNGAILGMTKNEIMRKFDEIIDFAEIEDFIDTPVKRYSSGMYVRLAFAVAAHLEPEILIVDEVLAVGDASFQKKCLGKMGDVAKGGRTVLFVSHNMSAVSALCSKGIVLKDGLINFQSDNVEDAIQHYLIQVTELQKYKLMERKDREGESKIRISDFKMFDKKGSEINNTATGQYIEFRIYYESMNNQLLNDIFFGIGIYTIRGEFLTLLSNQLVGNQIDLVKSKSYISCVVEKLPFSQGNYSLNLIVRQKNIVQDWIKEAVILNVESGDFFNTGQVVPDTHIGVYLEQKWSSN